MLKGMLVSLKMEDCWTCVYFINLLSHCDSLSGLRVAPPTLVQQITQVTDSTLSRLTGKKKRKGPVNEPRLESKTQSSEMLYGAKGRARVITGSPP